MSGVRARAALYACDESGTIVEWNTAAQKLTGIAAADAVGEKCWTVTRGHSADGEIVCHPGCSIGRLAAEGWPADCGCLLVATARGRKPLHISTILVRHDRELLVLHPMHNGIEIAEPESDGEPARLTPRQREVLDLLADGLPARRIAEELHLAETTVRNHIRAILRELCVHSQLEAVASARRRNLVG